MRRWLLPFFLVLGGLLRADPVTDADWRALADDPHLPGYHDPDFCGSYAASLCGKIARVAHEQATRVFVRWRNFDPSMVTRYHVLVTYPGNGKLWVADNMGGCRGSFPDNTPPEVWMKCFFPPTPAFAYDIVPASQVRF